jgi:hypothetical protein
MAVQQVRLADFALDIVNDNCNVLRMRASRKHRDRTLHKGNEPHRLREIVRTHQMLMAGFFRGIGMPASRVVMLRLLDIAERDVGIIDLAR